MVKFFMQNYLDKSRIEMLKLIESRYGFDIDGYLESEIPNLDFYFSNKPTEFNAIMYEPSICIILQGNKAVGFGNRLYRYGIREYLLSSTHIPAKVKIVQADRENPYISFRIKFKLEDIYEVIKNIKSEKKI